MAKEGDHLFAIAVGKNVYRDPETEIVDEATFTRIMNRRPLPPNHFAYHYSGKMQWDAVLALPVVGHGSVRASLEVLNQKLCTCCARVPAQDLCAECRASIEEINQE